MYEKQTQESVWCTGCYLLDWFSKKQNINVAWGGGGGGLDREKSNVFASRPLVVVIIDGSVRDWSQWLSNRFPWTTFATL